MNDGGKNNHIRHEIMETGRGDDADAARNDETAARQQRQAGFDPGPSVPGQIRRDGGSIDAQVMLGISRFPVLIHVARVSEEDMADEECVRVSSVAGTIACIAVDVVRGRLSVEGLYKFMTAPTVSKLVLLESLLHQDRQKKESGLADSEIYANRRTHAFLCRHMPVVPRRIHAMVVNPRRMNVVVSFSIGTELCWGSMRWQRMGGRWLCDYCDLG